MLRHPGVFTPETGLKETRSRKVPVAGETSLNCALDFFLLWHPLRRLKRGLVTCLILIKMETA